MQSIKHQQNPNHQTPHPPAVKAVPGQSPGPEQQIAPDAPPEARGDDGKKKCGQHICRRADHQRKDPLHSPATPSHNMSALPAEAGGVDPDDLQHLSERLTTATNGKLAISISKMAEILSISPPTAYALARSKGFPSFTVGGRTLVSVPGLLTWVEKASAGEVL